MTKSENMFLISLEGVDSKTGVEILLCLDMVDFS